MGRQNKRKRLKEGDGIFPAAIFCGQDDMKKSAETQAGQQNGDEGRSPDGF